MTEAPAFRRRALLAGIGALAVGSALRCSSPSSSSSPSPLPAATGAPAITPSAQPTASPRTSAPPDWAALRSALKGDLVLPNDRAYETARLLYNTRSDAVRPQAVARCVSAADVRECVVFARRSAVPLAVRSGGHSYGGYSTGAGLVIDTRPMNAVDVGAGDARVGAGAQLVDVYSALAARGLGIAAGSCPSVGIAGLTLAGGLGVLTRAWGLTCDSLLEAEVVTADGSIRTADERRDADLFWALRGGGGSSFGVVTSLTFRARPITRLALGFLRWDGSAARAVIAAWQRWIAAAPEELWSNLHLNAGPSSEVAVHATHVVDQASLGTHFDDLVRQVGSAPAYREVGALSYADAMLLEAGCLGRTVGQCHLHGDTADGVLDRETYAGTSVVIGSALGPAGLDAVASALTTDGVSAVIVDALGGAVARVAPDATAFPHRQALANIQVISSWAADAPAATADARRAALGRYRDVLRSQVGTGAYVGYIDPELPAWQAAYFGANYARLQQVKRRYDPDGLFDSRQGIART